MSKLYEVSYFCHYDGITTSTVKLIAENFKQALEKAEHLNGKYFQETNEITELKLLITDIKS